MDMKTKQFFALLLSVILAASWLPALCEDSAAPAETPAAADMPALFETGYAMLARDANVYKKIGGAAYTSLKSGSAVYASARVISSTGKSGDDWLLCHFAAAQGAVAGYIRARNLSPVAIDEAAAFEKKVAAAGSGVSYKGHPLALLECVIAGAATPVPGPTAKPVRTVKPLPAGKIVHRNHGQQNPRKRKDHQKRAGRVPGKRAPLFQRHGLLLLLREGRVIRLYRNILL